MRIIRRIAAVLLFISVLLCGCTKQRNMDHAEFCKRLNALQQNETLSAEAFFKEGNPAANEWNISLPFGSGETALLTLTSDTNGTVTAFQLTAVSSDMQNTPEAFRALYETYLQLVTVLTVCESTEESEALVRSAGILPESLGFTDFGFVGEAGAHCFSVFSGEMYISMFCERV